MLFICYFSGEVVNTGIPNDENTNINCSDATVNASTPGKGKHNQKWI